MSQANASELGNAGTAPGFKLWRLFKRGASVSGQGGRQTVDLSERIDQLLGLRLREFTMPADLLAIYHMQARSGTHRMVHRRRPPQHALRAVRRVSDRTAASVMRPDLSFADHDVVHGVGHPYPETGDQRFRGFRHPGGLPFHGDVRRIRRPL